MFPVAIPWLLVTSVLAAAPDLLPPGHRGVTHELALEDHEVFRLYRMVAGPIRGFHGLEVLEPGTPFRFSTKYGTKVYALPLDAPLPEDSPRLRTVPDDWPEEYLVGEIPLSETRGVPVVRWDRSGRSITRASVPILAALSALGLAGCIWLARTRSRPPPEAA